MEKSSPQSPVQISIVIPVYNSEENLRPLHAAIDEELKEFEYEVILVDDRSRDGGDTWEPANAPPQTGHRPRLFNVQMVDASHGYERIHYDSLESLARLVSIYMQSPPLYPRDRVDMGPRSGFPMLP